jgi:IS605 OrfB family transposase
MHNIRTLRFRVKDKHAPMLGKLAGQVNFVWNYCNETTAKAWARDRKWLTGYDLDKLTAGAGKEGLDLHSQSIQAINAEHATRRLQFKKSKLRWRVSRGAKRSLGWVPFKKAAVAYRNGQLHFCKMPISLWDSYGLAQYADTIKTGSFSEDARGRWYLNLCVEIDAAQHPKASVEDVAAGRANDIGIDLGLKEFLASSDGQKIEARRIYRGAEEKLAIAQRAGKKARVKAIHAQIGNRRKDFLHKLSTRLVRKHDAIFVGNVNAAALAKGVHAKSVLDAGWSTFRTMLRYKCDDAGVRFAEVDERYTSQACSSCGALPPSRPKGIADLGIRGWKCDECGTVHDRDVNAARNILARGRARLAVGIPVL